MISTNMKRKNHQRTKGFLLCIIATIAALLSCSGMGTRPSENDRNPIVVRAYLYAGKPVTDVRLLNLAETEHDTMVRLTRWDSFYMRSDSIDTVLTWVTESTIDNAVVTISNNGKSYGLAFTESGWYKETSGNLVVAAGQTYRIDVVAGDRHAWAETTVPLPVGGLTVSRSIIYKDSVIEQDTTDPCGKGGCKEVGKNGLGKVRSMYSAPTLPDSLTHLVAKWNNPSGSYLYYRCVVDTNSDYRSSSDGYIAEDSLGISALVFIMTNNGSGSTGMPGWKGLTLWYPKRYILYIYSTTPDYQSMLKDLARERYDSTHQNQDRWTRSPNNVHGGLGFFTSFSSDSIFFKMQSFP
jgi:hypothetical protein